MTKQRLVDMTPDQLAAHNARVEQRRKDREDYAARMAQHAKDTQGWKDVLNTIPISNVREATALLKLRRDAYIAEEATNRADQLTAWLSAAGLDHIARSVACALRSVPSMENYQPAAYVDGRKV